MKFILTSLIIFFGFTAAYAEHVICEPQFVPNLVDFPRMQIETSSQKITLEKDILFYEDLSGFFLAGTYQMYPRDAENKILRMELAASDLTYGCNFQNAYFKFDLNTDTIHIQMHCDGATGFDVFEVKMNCTHH